MRLGSEGELKFLSGDQLLKVVSSLPDDCFLATNAVGNLLVVKLNDKE